ncbi:MAG: Septum formation initiator [Caulobacteraceae bacterium]|nr:Septum formation initiator [Caulobacteraceae bacterium]
MAVLIVYFGGQLLTGERGLLSEGHRHALLASRTTELRDLTNERMDLEAQARLLRDGELSADLVEERARSLLGFADPRDYVIRNQP